MGAPVAPGGVAGPCVLTVALRRAHRPRGSAFVPIENSALRRELAVIGSSLRRCPCRSIQQRFFAGSSRAARSPSPRILWLQESARHNEILDVSSVPSSALAPYALPSALQDVEIADSG
ncbi:hypothetical protein C8F04DRAFT_1248670 [Mycena alexandri]|nr:hypothetical protein C8F04DRAFT_1248670 [Mycena alexandri]